MKRLVKRNNGFLIFSTCIVGLICIIACIIWGIICSNMHSDETNFWFISLEGIVGISINIVIGVFVTFLILYATDRNECKHKKQDLIYDILNQIEDYYVEKLPKLAKCNFYVTREGKRPNNTGKRIRQEGTNQDDLKRGSEQ